MRSRRSSTEIGRAAVVNDLTGARGAAAAVSPARATMEAAAALCKKVRRESMDIPWVHLVASIEAGYFNRVRFRHPLPSRSYSARARGWQQCRPDERVGRVPTLVVGEHSWASTEIKSKVVRKKLLERCRKPSEKPWAVPRSK